MNFTTQTVDLTTIADIAPGWALSAGRVGIVSAAIIAIIAWGTDHLNDSFRTGVVVAAVFSGVGALVWGMNAVAEADYRTNFLPYAKTIERDIATEHGWAPDDKKIDYRRSQFVDRLADVRRNLDTKGATYLFEGVKGGDPSTMYIVTNGTQTPDVEFKP